MRCMMLSRVASGSGGVALGTPLTLADAKAHLNVSLSIDDTLITALCSVARAHLEGADGTGGILGKAISQHVLDGTFDAFPDGDEIELPQPPLVEVTSVKYYDTSNVLQTLSSASYHVITDPLRPRIVLASGASWPDTYDRPDPVTIRFSVGPGEIPADIMHALKLHVDHLYQNRGIALEKSLTAMPMGYAALIAPHKSHGWI